VDVAGARREIGDRPVAERVLRVLQVEDPAVEAWIVRGIDAIVVPRAADGARALIEATASALEEDHQLLGVAAPQPERVRAPTRAARLAAG
jgi:hypothetical protein